MAPKKMSKKESLKPILEAEPEPPPPPPPRDPLVPLTFDELWFDADAEIEGEEQKKVAQDLKIHIMAKAVDIRRYLEESNMVALLLQALQHLILDRPLDPFRYLARFLREYGPKIEAELQRCRDIDACKRAKHAADDQARLDAEGAAREAEAKAKRDAEAARLATAARAAALAAKEAKALADVKAAAEAAAAAFKSGEAAAAAVKTGPTVDKKKEPGKPAGPKKPEWKR